MTTLKSADQKGASASPWWMVSTATVTRVLWADDDATLRALGRAMLARAGYAVTCVCDGMEARDELQRAGESYDVLITDHDMPRLNGLGLVAAARANGFRGGVVVVSGSIDSRLATAYRATGVDEILAKPVEAARLLAAVDAARGK